MQIKNTESNQIISIIDDTRKVKGIGAKKTPPKPEKIIIKASTFDTETENLQIVLNAVNAHKSIVYKTNIAIFNKKELVEKLDGLLIVKKDLKEHKLRLKNLKELKQTPRILNTIQRGEYLIKKAEKNTAPKNIARIKKEIEQYEVDLKRYYSWQENALGIYKNEVFPSDEMKANYLFSLWQYHDEVDLVTLYDKKLGKKASFALCKVSLSTMQQYFGDPSYDKHRYVVYPFDSGYKDFSITIQDMAKYRESKAEVFDALTAKHISRTLIPGTFAIIDDTQKEEISNANTPEYKADDNQANAKVTAGVPEGTIAKR